MNLRTALVGIGLTPLQIVLVIMMAKGTHSSALGAMRPGHRGRARSFATAAMDCRKSVPPRRFVEAYRARPGVNAVMHTHPQWSTFLTMTGVTYQPVYAQGVLLGDIPLMDSPLSINTKPMGEKMAQILGAGPAVLLKAHGVVVVGADIVECFALAAYVEENAYRQYMAMQIGEPYVFSEAEQKASREKLWTPSLFKKTWDHYRSKLP
jgi:L-fuculose-phosphate aldolase